MSERFAEHAFDAIVYLNIVCIFWLVLVVAGALAWEWFSVRRLKVREVNKYQEIDRWMDEIRAGRMP